MVQLNGLPAPASKKNRREWIKRGRKKFLVPSKEAQSDESLIHRIAVAKAGALAGPTFPDQDVELRIVYHARTGTVDVDCEPIRPRPKGFSGRRRDLHGMIETIADALQNAVYTNDNQVARVVIERLLD